MRLRFFCGRRPVQGTSGEPRPYAAAIRSSVTSRRTAQAARFELCFGRGRAICAVRIRVNMDRCPHARARGARRFQRAAPPLSVLQIFRSVVDDPVPRCAHPALRRPGGSSRSLGAAAADAVIIDRPSSIVAPNLRTTIPLNRNGDVNQQPARPAGAPASRACKASDPC